MSLLAKDKEDPVAINVYPETGNPGLTYLGTPSSLGSRRQLDEYDYEHFRPKHRLANLWKTLRDEGLQPGSEAPDSETETTEGKAL